MASSLVQYHHFLSGCDVAGERLGQRGVLDDEEQVCGGEGDPRRRVPGLDDAERSSPGAVAVREHDKLAVDQVPELVRCQDLVSRFQVLHLLHRSILQADASRAGKTATRLRCHRVLCREGAVDVSFG
ncbi:hypothetical protein PDJAM_G00205730, partial [Pangasius djambal]|nr:hypothetical protein [Pangasius djambal]